jgi:predicted PurR-regulated permease PerM
VPRDRLSRNALIVWIAVGVVALTWVALMIADAVRVIWMPVALGAGIMFVLEPVVKVFERLRLPRFWAVILSFSALLALVVAGVALVLPALRDQSGELVADLPNIYEGFLDWLREMGNRFNVNVDAILTEDFITDWLDDPGNQETVTDFLLGIGAGAGRLIRGVTDFVLVVGLTPVLALYILIDLERFKKNSLELTPPRHREEASFIAGQVGTAVGSFVRGQMLVSAIVGVASSIGMWVIDLPFWLLVGILAGVLNLIPFAGPIVGGALAAIVALLHGNVTQAIVAVVIFTAIQQVDNHVITPMVQRARVSLSPLVIVLALVIGGSLAGLVGVLIAVPFTAAVRIVIGHFWRTRVLGQSWREASEGMIEITEPPERIAGIRRRNPDQTRLFDTQEMTSLQLEPEDNDNP